MKNLKEKIATGLLIIIYLFGAIGWILNLASFIKLDFQAPYKAEVFRGIGVISPVGSIVGYFNIKD